MEWNPGKKYRIYLDAIQTVLDSGEQRTVRDVYYALESRGFADTLDSHGHEFEYRYVKRAVKKGRRSGYIDPEMIFDASRVPEVTQTGSDPAPEEWVRQVENQVKNNYYLDFWDDQPKHVEVWLEKQSLASVFSPICDEYNVRLEATRGDWSDSKVYEATQRVVGKMEDGNDVHVLYFGDFNPSGLHAPVAIQQTIAYYGWDFRPQDEPDERYFECWPFIDNGIRDPRTEQRFAMDRIALTLDQVERYDLPENPTPSSTDKDRQLRERFMEHASDGRDVNIELNALKEYHRNDLEQMLRDAIESRIDDEQKRSTKDRQQTHQERIKRAVDFDYSVLGGND